MFHALCKKIEIKLRTGVDGKMSRPYRVVCRGDERFVLLPLPQQSGRQGPRSNGQGFVVGIFALFLIVGLDEGTCGRRPRV